MNRTIRIMVMVLCVAFGFFAGAVVERNFGGVDSVTSIHTLLFRIN